MEALWQADRSRLRAAPRDHPDWSARELALELGRSMGWVVKWKRRLRLAAPDDEAVLRGRSHARAVTEAFRRHSNAERPNQAVSCANRPPQMASPTLPSLPPTPAEVEPDGWLRAIDGRCYGRAVRHNGSVQVAEASYDVQQALAGQLVLVVVEAAAKTLRIMHGGVALKRPPIKGLQQRALIPFAGYLDPVRGQARTAWRAPQPRQRQRAAAQARHPRDT